MVSYWRTIACICALSVVAACGGSRVEPPVFDGERAMSYLVGQVAFGPRVPGSEASALCRDYFNNHFAGLGLSIDSQVTSFVDPYSRVEIPLVNVVGSYRSEQNPDLPGIVFMAHYDSRPRAEYATEPELMSVPIDGANDGASGCAVLMELANLIAERAPARNVDLVMVDGEDWGKEGHHEYYMLGSREFARYPIRDTYEFGIVLDMIGDKDQQIYREGISEQSCKPVNDMVWGVANRLGITTFKDTVHYQIQDDHLSLMTAGVPAVVIIDFTYPYWHTQFDTVDKCSGQSLANVGRVVAEIIYNESLWPSKK